MPENSGINILPQFNGSLPVDPNDPYNPLNQPLGGYPSGPPPAFPGNFGGAPSNARNYPVPGSYNAPAASLPTGVTPSAGGWNIDSNGNLVPSWGETGQNYGRSVGNFVGSEAGRFLPIPGSQQLGGFFGRQVGSAIGHGIGGLVGSISHGLGKLFGRKDAGTTNQSAAPAGPAFGTVFNAGRGAFSPTYQQINNPGSAIGPTSGATSNPYAADNPNFRNGLAKPGAHTTSIPSFAMANMAYVRSKNQR